MRTAAGNPLHLARLAKNRIDPDLRNLGACGRDYEFVYSAPVQYAQNPSRRIVERLSPPLSRIVAHVDVCIAEHRPLLYFFPAASIICLCFSSTTSWLIAATLQKCSAGLSMSPVSLKLRHKQTEQ